MTSSQTHDSTESPADELARLRLELAALKGSPRAPADTERRGWWRPVVAGALIVLAAVLAPLSVLATWSNGQIQDTDRYLATVAPLADDPDVQEAIATRMDEVVVGLEGQGLPSGAATTLGALSQPLAEGVRNFVGDRIDALVQSDAFEQAWAEA